jgi:hypothetical protein
VLKLWIIKDEGLKMEKLTVAINRMALEITRDSISDKDKIRCILSRYANSLALVTKGIIDGTNGVYFSEFAVKNSLNSIGKDKLDNIYSRLKMIK